MDTAAINTVEWLLKLFKAYEMAGFFFAIVFVLFLVQLLDHGARTWGLGFRVLIFPGVIAFWPLFLYRLLRHFMRGHREPMEHNAHRDLAAHPPMESGGANP